MELFLSSLKLFVQLAAMNAPHPKFNNSKTFSSIELKSMSLVSEQKNVQQSLSNMFSKKKPSAPVRSLPQDWMSPSKPAGEKPIAPETPPDTPVTIQGTQPGVDMSPAVKSDSSLDSESASVSLESKTLNRVKFMSLGSSDYIARGLKIYLVQEIILFI